MLHINDTKVRKLNVVIFEREKRKKKLKLMLMNDRHQCKQQNYCSFHSPVSRRMRMQMQVRHHENNTNEKQNKKKKNIKNLKQYEINKREYCHWFFLLIRGEKKKLFKSIAI